ncbi:MAG: hypothetical protein V1844_08500 [Pseudomonadota bacterium]
MSAESEKNGEKGGQVIKVSGGIHARGDVVMHDQFNYSTVVDIQNLDQFVKALQNVQAKIGKEGKEGKQGQLNSVQVRNLEDAENRVGEAVAEAGQAKPLLERINTSLTGAREIMEMLGSGVNAAVALGKTIGDLAVQAARFFV